MFNEYGKELQHITINGTTTYTYLEDKRRLKSVHSNVYTKEYTWDGLSYEMIETYHDSPGLPTTYYGKINEFGQTVESKNWGENSKYYINEYDCELFDPIPINPI